MNITIMGPVFEPIDPENQVTADWEEIAEFLLAFNKTPSKESTPMFNMWQFKTIEEGAELGRKYHDKSKQTWDYTPNTIRRCRNNVLGLWGLVLDYDGKKTIEEAVMDLDGLECVLYTTFNHTPEKNKFRVVIPFSRMLPADEFENRSEDITELFEYVDPASFSMSQAIYLHSGNEQYAMSFHMAGESIDPFGFKINPPKPVVEGRPTHYSSLISDASRDRYKTAVLASLYSCQNIRRGCNNKEAGGLGLSLLVKSVGGSYADFCDICSIAAGADSSMRDPIVQRATWDAVTTEKATKEFRDKFIQAYRGLPLSETMKDSTQIALAMTLHKE